MSLKIYNTATRTKEVFEPIQQGRVGIYVCGITAYDVCHVGHARAAIVFDVVARYLQTTGYQVTYVKNFTDIDDKIIDRANREGVDFTEIAQRYMQAYEEDMAALGIQPPTVAPKATEHIGDMIALIKNLEDRGYAYCVDGDVYFAIQRDPDYGKLSGRNLEEMMAGARVEINDKKEVRWISLFGKKQSGRTFLGKSMGERASRLAYRMFCDEPALFGRDLRHSRRWRRFDFPAS